MGQILALNPAFEGMSTIVNVLDRVGPRERNNPDDVRVVQQLLQIYGGAKSLPGVGMPQVTGSFDATTGFWIFEFQAFTHQDRPGQIVDGCVSPAQGAVYTGSGVWTIVLLNYNAKRHNPAQYATFLAQSSS
jgi:hypothetical protein